MTGYPSALAFGAWNVEDVLMVFEGASACEKSLTTYAAKRLGLHGQRGAHFAPKLRPFLSTSNRVVPGRMAASGASAAILDFPLG